VHKYSSCDLTFPSDRLVAISGIAKSAQSAVPDDYFAGMWRRNIEHSICWYRGSITPLRKRPAIYQAPSWSWACLPPSTGVSFHNSGNVEIDTLFAKVVDIDMTLAGPDPMGPVQRGLLRVQCQALLSGMNVRGQQYYYIATIGSVVTAVYLDFDCELIMASAAPFYLLPVFQQPEKKKECMYVQGLILRPTNKVKGEYQRIGRFREDTTGMRTGMTPKIFKRLVKWNGESCDIPRRIESCCLKTAKVKRATLHHNRLRNGFESIYSP
jgi:hypothetical protein